MTPEEIKKLHADYFKDRGGDTHKVETNNTPNKKVSRLSNKSKRRLFWVSVILLGLAITDNPVIANARWDLWQTITGSGLTRATDGFWD